MRRGTKDSDESTSSTGSSEHTGTMLVSINESELHDIIGFLKQASASSPESRPAMSIWKSRPSSTSSAQWILNRRPSIALRGPPIERRKPDDVACSIPYHGSASTTRDSPTHPISSLSSGRSGTVLETSLSQVLGSTTDPTAIVQSIQEASQRTPKLSSIREKDVQRLNDVGESLKDSPYKKEHVWVSHASRNTSGNSGEISMDKSHKPLDTESLQRGQTLAGWYYRKGDLDEADQLYKNLLVLYGPINPPNSIVFGIRLHIAQIRWFQGGHRESEQDFKALNDMVDNFFDEALICKTAKWLALSQWKQGKYTEAKATIQGCVDKDPDERKGNKALLSTRALILASAGSFKRALEDSNKAIGGESGKLDRNELPETQTIIYNVNHARVLCEIGRYKEAAEKNKAALSNLQKRWGPKHFITLDAASLRAWLSVVMSNTSGAGEEVQQTLRQMRERLGEDHPSTLQTVQTLVLAYKNDGRYSDAETTARYLLAKCEANKELGHAHPQTLKSKTILAEVLLAVGAWREAEEYQREVVKDEKATYLQRLTLANILREVGKWDEARDLATNILLEQLHKFSSDEEKDSYSEHDQTQELSGEQISPNDLRHILHKSKYVRDKLHKLPLGPFDPTAGPDPVRVYPSLVQTMQCVALCEQVRDDANLAFSEALLESIHDICDRRLGKFHQYTVAIEHDLAVNHRLSGKFLDARKVITHVVEQRRNTLGTDHPDYLLSRHQFSVILLRLSKWQEALKEQESVLRAQEFLLGALHPMTVLSRYTLAGIYHSLHRYKEAEDYLAKVIEDQRRIFNPTRTEPGDHAVVIRSRARLALVQLDRALTEKNDASIEQKNALFDSSRIEQMAVVEHRSQHLGSNHHLTQSSLNDLAQIEQASGNITKAEEKYESLLSTISSRENKSTNSKSHERILAFQVKSNLATCFYEMEQYQKAEKLQNELYSELRRDQGTDDRFVASAFNLALTCKALEQYQRACKLLRETVKASQDLLGDSHPQTRELNNTLTEWNKQYADSDTVDRTKDWSRKNSENFAKNDRLTDASIAFLS